MPSEREKSGLGDVDLSLAFGSTGWLMPRTVVRAVAWCGDLVIQMRIKLSRHNGNLKRTHSFPAFSRTNIGAKFDLRCKKLHTDAKRGERDDHDSLGSAVTLVTSAPCRYS